jgi:hypothetical protein
MYHYRDIHYSRIQKMNIVHNVLWLDLLRNLTYIRLFYLPYCLLPMKVDTLNNLHIMVQYNYNKP